MKVRDMPMMRLRVPPELLEAIREEAKTERRSMNFIVIEKLEQVYRSGMKKKKAQDREKNEEEQID